MTTAASACLMRLVVQTRPLALTATLPGTPFSVPVARQLARAMLLGCPRADDLMLAVTELATNAIAHSASGQGGSFTLSVRTGPQWAMVEVTDEGPASQPVTGNGWGLALSRASPTGPARSPARRLPDRLVRGDLARSA